MNHCKEYDRSVNDLKLYLAGGMFTDQKPDVSMINWTLFLESVFAEGISGLIYHNLIEHKRQILLPSWVSDRLKENYVNNTGRNLFIIDRLKTVTERFREEEIPFLLIRGINLIDDVYPSLGVRMITDVDGVINKENLPQVTEIFKELGYVHPLGYPCLFYKDDVFFDIHLDKASFWRISSWPQTINIKDKDIWESAQLFSKETPFIRKLGLYDSIIVACSHLQEHSYERLIWFLDVRALILKNRERFQWQILIERAYKYRLHKPLFFVLRYLLEKQLLDIPKEVVLQLSEMDLNSFEKRSLQMLLNDKRTSMSGELLYLFSVKGILSRLEFIWQTIFLKSDLFPLVKEKLTYRDYLSRMLKIMIYSARKMFMALKI